VRHLIERGADIHTQCNSLTHASVLRRTQQQPEYFEYLLQAGAEIDVPDFLDRTPLAIAVRDGNPALVKSLIENGADPFRKDRHSAGRTFTLPPSKGTRTFSKS